MTFITSELGRKQRLYGNGAPLQYPQLIAPPPRKRRAVDPEMVFNAIAETERRMKQEIEGVFAAAPPLPKPEPQPKPRAVHVCPGHTRRVFDIATFPEVAEWAAREVLAHKIDAIAGCGHSGLLLAGAVSVLTKLPAFAVRKYDEASPVAGTGPVSGIAPNGPAKRWCWVDDLIGSGGTLARSMRLLLSEGLVEDKRPALVLLYMTGGDDGLSSREISGSQWERSFASEPQPELLIKRYANRDRKQN